MDSPLIDQSRDPLLAFASEASVAPTADREPAFLRTPTPYDGHLSITSVAERAPSETVRGWRVTTVLVVVGVMAGFAGGYVFADRIITPAVTPSHRITAPVSAPAPARTAAAAPTVAAAASSESAQPSTAPSTEPAREAGATSTPSAPPSTPRASIPSSTRRPSTTTRPRPAVPPTTLHSGAIEIMSRPRDGRVFLDGIAVGRHEQPIGRRPHGVKLDRAGNARRSPQ